MQLVILFLFSLLAGSNHLMAAEPIRVAGWGGTDTEIMHELLSEVLVEELAELGLEVIYQPVESNYSQFIVNSLSSGTAPDLFYVDVSMVDVFTDSGLLAEVDAAPGVFQSRLLSAFSRDSVLYSVPKDFNALAVVYNQDIFVDAGVDVPTSSDNFEQFRRRLSDVRRALAGEGVHGVCLSPDFTRFAPFLFATGWSPMDESGRTVVDERFRRAFLFFTGLFEDGLAVLSSALGQNWSGGCFGAERTAIAIEGNWIVSFLKDKAPNLLFNATLTPKDDETHQRGNLLFTVGWAINHDSKRKTDALKVLDLLTSRSAQRWVLGSGLALPSRVDMVEASGDVLEPNSGEAAMTAAVYGAIGEGYVQPFAFSPYGQAWVDPINEGLSSVLIGGVSQESALDRIQERYDYLYQQHYGEAQ